MPPSPEPLDKILQRGDVGDVVKFFHGLTEAGRKAVSPVAMDWCKRLNLQWRAGFNAKAAAEVARSGAIGNWRELKPAVNAAALACATIAEMKTIGLFNVSPESTVEILRDRKPAWIDDYAEFLCEGELRGRGGGHWKEVRALVRAGLCRPPKHDHYVLNALEGIWPRFDHSKPEPVLVDLLLKERDWLEKDFWRLFELEGNGEISLANCDKYGRTNNGWPEALCELSKKGLLSRDRLLDESLAALSRDFLQFRAGWFSRFHEALEPTPGERAARIDACLRLLASSIPPTVAFAVNAVANVDKAQPLPAAKLIDALPPALNTRGKAVVKTGLKLLDAAARRESSSRKAVCLAALPALLNEATDVQKSVFDLLDHHGDKNDAKLKAKIGELAGAVAASLKPRLVPWTDQSSKPASPKKSVISKEASAPRKALSRIDPTRAIQPLSNLEDLIHTAGIVLEEPASPADIERMLDGLSRFCDQRPEDFDRRTGPLRKRALKKKEFHKGGWPLRPAIERGLALLLLTWIDGQDGFSEAPEKLGHGQNQYAFLFRRLAALGLHVVRRRSLPLLSAPTHAGGWIEPAILVNRWLAWQEAGLAPDPHEQVLALLRLAPESRAQPLGAAKKLGGEAGQAVRFALGEECRTGRNPALWLAAWRSRQPHGDLVEYEKAHPGLGPDGGAAASYLLGARAKPHTYQEKIWTSLELAVKTEPACPDGVADTLLPVLFHGKWQTSEEGELNLIRWAMLLWPANREAMFARASNRLGISVTYADASDREYCAYLEPLSDPHAGLGPMANLVLALGLASEDASLRGHAQDGLIAVITEDRLKSDDLGRAMSLLFDTGTNKFARWAKIFREVARVSPPHTRAMINLIVQLLNGDPAKAPRDVAAFLELLVELLSETGDKLTDQRAREYLTALTIGGKTAKLVKQLLAV